MCKTYGISGICLVFLFGVQPDTSETLAEEMEYSIKAPLAAESLLLDITTAGGKLIAVGEKGHILLSEDGSTWEQANVPARSTLTSVFFHDKNTGWAAGHDEMILRTTDGGVIWKRVFYQPEDERPFLDLWFENENRGIAVGAYGLYFTTIDGGKTWIDSGLNVFKEITVEEESDEGEESGTVDFTESYELHLNSITRSDSGKLYIAAEAGRIYRSDDLGNTWLELPSPYIGSFFGVLPLDGDSLLVYGLRGHMYRSADAGLSWEPVETQTNEMLTSGVRLADGTIIIAGLGGTLLISYDGGVNFRSVDLNTRNGFSAVVEKDDRELLLVGENGVRKLKVADLQTK
jgi:photosystem II stability/assembly factor-like uncharacterized protein